MSLNRLMVYLIFIIFTLLTLYPLLWLFYSSFKSKGEYLMNQVALPRDWTVTNYVDAITLAHLDRYTVNSIIYTAGSTLLILLFSSMVGYAFTKTRFRRTSALFYSIFGLGLLISTHSLLIPLFLFLRSLRLTNTHAGIILPYVAINLPLAIFLATGYMKGLPDALIESAHIDGASHWKTFALIILPMCTPVLITTGIITVLACWNEFLLVFILASSEATKSLPVGIFAFAGEMTTEYGMLFAALVIGTLPMLLVYAFFNKRITVGVGAGSIKG